MSGDPDAGGGQNEDDRVLPHLLRVRRITSGIVIAGAAGALLMAATLRAAAGNARALAESSTMANRASIVARIDNLSTLVTWLAVGAAVCAALGLYLFMTSRRHRPIPIRIDDPQGTRLRRGHAGGSGGSSQARPRAALTRSALPSAELRTPESR